MVSARNARPERRSRCSCPGGVAQPEVRRGGSEHPRQSASAVGPPAEVTTRAAGHRPRRNTRVRLQRSARLTPSGLIWHCRIRARAGSASTADGARQPNADRGSERKATAKRVDAGASRQSARRLGESETRRVPSDEHVYSLPALRDPFQGLARTTPGFEWPGTVRTLPKSVRRLCDADLPPAGHPRSGKARTCAVLYCRGRANSGTAPRRKPLDSTISDLAW